MPSFRARLQIGDVLPGHTPPEVMAQAELAVGTTHNVEAKDIEVVARVPRIVLRFTVPESTPGQEVRQALEAGQRMREAVAEVATVGHLEVLLRTGGRWEHVGSAA